MKRLSAVAVALICGLGLMSPSPSQAGNYGQFVYKYEIQVEYAHFNYDYSYWSTVYSTTDGPFAEWVYNRLLYIKSLGELDDAVPSSNPSFIAVDVRLVKKKVYIFPSESSPKSGVYSQHQSRSYSYGR